MANPINIIGGFYKDDTLSWACQDTVNYLPTQAEVSGTKTPSMLRTPPGLRPWVKIGDGPNFAIRGMHDAEGRLFVVSGTRLYQISNNGIAVPLGIIPGRGRVSIAHNQIAGGNEILVVNGNSGYVWNTLKQTFTRITDPGYPGAFQAVFADGYLIQAEPFGRFLFHSNLADALDYNTLDRLEAESEPDKVVAVIVSNDEVRVFGERTTQIFSNTGAAQGTFQSKGITINRGCAGRWTALAMDNGVFFLGDDGVVYRDNGYSPVRISTYAIEQAIADNDWSQAFAFAWENRGHSVYYLTFPDGQTWGYDVSSGAWHRRASYHPTYEVSRRWRLNDLVYSNGQWIGGDSTSGKLFVLDWGYMLEDVDTELVSERSTQIAYADGARFSVDMVDLVVGTGALPTIPGSVIFPDQPVGPTISGNAPDGYIGQVYSYQYTVTPGDAPIVKVSADLLPKGLTLSNTGLLSGKLEEDAVTKFKVRVTDSNGLWDELDDTITVSSAWALLKVQDAATNKIWLSSDPLSWPDEALIAPIAPSPGFATRGIFGQGLIALPRTVGAAAQVSFPPVDGVMESTLISLTNVNRIRVVRDLAFAFRDAGSEYYYLQRGSDEWMTGTVPDGGSIFDIVLLDDGRWISYLVNGPSSKFIYSDQEIPTVWQSGAANSDATTGYAMACDGKRVLMLASLARTLRTKDAVSVEVLTGSGGQYTDSRDAIFANGRFVFCGQSGFGPGNIISTSDLGNTYERHEISDLDSVERIYKHRNGWVASGQGKVNPSQSLVFVSSGDLNVWLPSVMPYEVTASAEAIAVSLAQ